jgi:hypothetical protein
MNRFHVLSLTAALSLAACEAASDGDLETSAAIVQCGAQNQCVVAKKGDQLVATDGNDHSLDIQGCTDTGGELRHGSGSNDWWVCTASDPVEASGKLTWQPFCSTNSTCYLDLQGVVNDGKDPANPPASCALADGNVHLDAHNVSHKCIARPDGSSSWDDTALPGCNTWNHCYLTAGNNSTADIGAARSCVPAYWSPRFGTDGQGYWCNENIFGGAWTQLESCNFTGSSCRVTSSGQADVLGNQGALGGLVCAPVGTIRPGTNGFNQQCIAASGFRFWSPVP